MNDDELITAVRESVTGVHMNIPADQIVSRSRAIRARRRIPGLAGALAAATAAALAVTALLPASHQASPQPGAQLAAWTVVKQADGTIYVTIRQLRDPAGLQRRLRVDGVPATVTFFGQPYPRACRRYPAGPDLIIRVFSGHGPPLVIHPSALPQGTGVQLNPGHYPPGAPIAIAAGLVYATPRCTGS
jgi:hypothetical protein